MIEGAHIVSPMIVVGSIRPATAGFAVTRESFRVRLAEAPSTLTHPGNANVEFQAVIESRMVTLSFA